MSQTPLMPMATAVWLVENTTLTFKQIADFCNLHEVEVQGIADGEVAKGIKAYNPITSGQLTKEEIELSSKDQDRALKITNTDVKIAGIGWSQGMKFSSIIMDTKFIKINFCRGKRINFCSFLVY